MGFGILLRRDGALHLPNPYSDFGVLFPSSLQTCLLLPLTPDIVAIIAQESADLTHLHGLATIPELVRLHPLMQPCLADNEPQTAGQPRIHELSGNNTLLLAAALWLQFVVHSQSFMQQSSCCAFCLRTAPADTTVVAAPTCPSVQMSSSTHFPSDVSVSCSCMILYSCCFHFFPRFCMAGCLSQYGYVPKVCTACTAIALLSLRDGKSAIKFQSKKLESVSLPNLRCSRRPPGLRLPW